MLVGLLVDVSVCQLKNYVSLLLPLPNYQLATVASFL